MWVMAAAQETLQQMRFYEGDDLIVKRIVSRSGRNRVYINGHLATVAMLAPVSESLVSFVANLFAQRRQPAQTADRLLTELQELEEELEKIKKA